jgi:hypothetical protein
LSKKPANVSERIKLYRQILLSIAVIFLLLFLFIPFGSTNPDGLDKTAESMGVGSAPLWEGLFPQYSVVFIENPWISTFLAGVIGILLVFAVTFLVTKVYTLRSLQSSGTGKGR